MHGLANDVSLFIIVACVIFDLRIKTGSHIIKEIKKAPFLISVWFKLRLRASASYRE